MRLSASALLGFSLLALGACAKRDVPPVPAPPGVAVFAVTPVAGPIAGGTVVTVTGAGFQAGAALRFAGTAATGVAVVDAATITGTTPAGAVGTATVSVTNPDGVSGALVAGFLFTGPAPTITAVSPATGPTAGGTTVTITGTNFAAGATVTIGGAAATVGTIAATVLVATTPAGTMGPAAVVVTNLDASTATLAGGFTYLGPVPTLTAIAPTSGSNAGGTAITLTGTNFAAGATVTIGGVAATSVVVVSATALTAVAPAVAPALGPLAVTVTNVDGQTATLAGGWNALGPQPTLTAIAPFSGTSGGGTVVTLTGTNFATGATVTIGGAAATSVVVVSATSCTAFTPAGSVGQATVVLTNLDGRSATLTNGYTYVSGPGITSVNPNTGTSAGGTTVTITGTGFAGGATVTIGGSAATSVTIVSVTQITAITPAGAVGPAAVTVTNPGPSATTLPGGFTFTGPAPTVTSVTPASGPMAGGTTITIAGTNFAAGATVRIGGVAASVGSVTAAQIVATTPAGTMGPKTVLVTNLDGNGGSLGSAFTYLGPAPTVTGIAPTSGPAAGGTTVTITGTNFATGATVTIGTAAATIGSVAPTTIVATTPAGTLGPRNVTVTNVDLQAATLSNGYTYMGPAPTLTSLNPVQGPNTGGTVVTLTGTNFAAGATVTFGGVAATGVTVTSGTSATATTPNVSPTLGTANVVFTNADAQSATLTNGWTWLGAAPTLIGVGPRGGPRTGGQTVYVNGSGFQFGATVTFGTVACTVTNTTPTTLVVATGVSATTGQVNVVVTNPDAQSATLSNGWSWLGPAPTVSAIAPAIGPNTGNTLVTLTGTNFATGVTVDVEYWGCSSVTLVSATTITCRTPNVAPGVGWGNVTVTNADAQIAFLPGAFLFQGPTPTVTAIAPTGGPAGGGTLVTISGTNFDVTPSVAFGATAATGVTMVSATAITCYTPAGTGAVSATVTNIDNKAGTGGSYTYSGGGPTAASVTPNNGALSGGTAITITGTNFSTGDTVRVGTASATSVVIVNSTTITAVTPAGPLGYADVRVTDTGGSASTLPDAFLFRNGVNAQTAAYTWDTSVGIDCTRRWYVNLNHASFLKDLQNRGLQSWGTPGDTSAPPANLPLVDQYALDWMRAYQLRTSNIIYGRNPDGTKIPGQSVNITFCGLQPTTGQAGCNNAATDWSLISCGGCGVSNGGTHPSASQTGTGCGGGVIGTAPYDTGAAGPCNSYAELVANSVYQNCASCPTSLGIFSANIGNAWNQSLTGGRLTTSDQQYLDGTTNSGTRYNQIHDFMKQFSRRIAFVACHEMGHSLGLASDATVGNCRSSSGQCSATGAHNACCGANLMAPTLSLGASATDYSKGMSGNPDPANPAKAASCGSPTEWQVLQSYLGLSP